MNIYEMLVLAKKSLLIGLMNTLIASASSIIIGTIIGVALGTILTYGNKYVRLPFRLLVDIIRGVPGLVTIFAVFYMIDFVLRAWGISANVLVIGTLALSIPASVQVADVCRGALQTIPKGQIEGGRAIGLRGAQIFLYILFPQAAVQMLPPWTNVATETVKGTTLLMLIGISELLLNAQQLVARRGHALFFYIFIGLVYFAINTAIEYSGKKLEKKLSIYKRK